MSDVTIRASEPLRPTNYNAGQIALIRRTVAADCNSAEFDLFIEVAKRVGLDPFRRQIYAVVYNKDNADKRKLAIITGIDGFRAVAARSGQYRPAEREAEITYDETLKDPATNPLGIEKAVVTIYKYGPDREWHPVIGVAYWQEFAPIVEEWAYNEEERKRRPTGKFALPDNSNWRKMGRVMIAKCATAQACRAGWPEDLSGVYAPEEMERTILDVTPSEAADEAEKDERKARINAKDAVPIQWQAGAPLEYVPVGQFADRTLAFLKAAESVVQVEAWKSINVIGLNSFWASHKADALEVKKQIEARCAELEKKKADD